MVRADCAREEVFQNGSIKAALEWAVEAHTANFGKARVPKADFLRDSATTFFRQIGGCAWVPTTSDQPGIIS